MHIVENKIGSYGYQLGKHICEIELKSPCEDIDVPSLCDKILELNPVSHLPMGIQNNTIDILFKSDLYDLTGDKSSVMLNNIFSHIKEIESEILIRKILIRDIGKRPITHDFHYTMKKNVLGSAFHGDLIIYPKSFVEDYVDRLDMIQYYFRQGQIAFVIDNNENAIAEVVEFKKKFFPRKERFRYDLWFVPSSDMSIGDKEILRKVCLKNRLNFGYNL